MKATLYLLGGLTLSLTLLTAIAPSNLRHDAVIHRLPLNFYAQPIRLAYDAEMVIEAPGQLSNASIRAKLSELDGRTTHVLLNSLLEAKQRFQLNDFLFYRLARRAVSEAYAKRDANAQELTIYRMLLDAGFDARLTFRGNRLFVNVYTEEELFEVPIIDSKGRAYANVSCMDGNCNGRQRLYIFADHPNPRGRSFGFQLNRWPDLATQPIDRELKFRFHNSEQRLRVTFDKTMVDIMADYPFIHEYCYLETPLSPTLAGTLLPQLGRMMENLDERAQLEFLASFTRSAFSYKEDNENFGRSKPMVPEELFGYSYSDCEDRSALFFALVRDLIGTDMAVIAYDDHLSVAVASETIEGDSFRYRGRRYIFCDPTGPRNSSRIGQIPPGYENKRFTIIGRTS